MNAARIVSLAIGLLIGLLLLIAPGSARAQSQPPSEFITINSDQAFTWSDGPSSVVQLKGPLTIQTDRATMTADAAVLWITPVPGSVLEEQTIEASLMGHANVQQDGIDRSGDSLFISTQVRGNIRVTAQQRTNQNLSDSDIYHGGASMRPLENIPPGASRPDAQWVVNRPWEAPSSQPTTAPTTQQFLPTQPISFHALNFQTVQTPDDHVAIVLSGNVTMFQRRTNGDYFELQAARAVLFTPLHSLRDMNASQQMKKIEEAVVGAYLEDDVRITYQPYDIRKGNEQRMRAHRVYYDFTTDRATLTDAVVSSIEPRTQLPIIMRAQTVRQLSLGEYKAEHVQLTTSSFAVPSYSIYSQKAYVHQTPTDDPRLGTRTDFVATNNFLDLWGVPAFYFPVVGGEVTERGTPLRGILFGSSRGFGPGVRTTWGLFESIGQAPPEDLDAQYHLDYFSNRGPAGGLDVDYGGSVVNENTKQPWNFKGDFTGYAANDHGTDKLGHQRNNVEPEQEFRYNVQWQHQHFFPEDWQLQVRAGILSDPTFLEEWFQHDFDEGLPHDVSAYLKHQHDTEALTLLVEWQPNRFVTTADQLQEQFDVERIPEVGYYRIGDSFGDDRFTFFSANTISGLRFNRSDVTLADEGFKPQFGPGISALGQTGTPDEIVYRGDFRQEVDYPLNVGQFKFVPYVMGRYQPYSDSPENSSENRVFVGTGMRLTTAFWKVDDFAQSDLFDIHRVRHVIEPELNLFTSGQTIDRTNVYDYDQGVDPINDITGGQIALHQRWQTKRGGAGQWRSVDFFTLNLEANFFNNQPSDAQNTPDGFRGLYFPTEPEASLPRNSINGDALWRVSDETAVLSDVGYNLDQNELATASIGLAVQRDVRVSYFVGTRYIGQLNSVVASFGAGYQITPKYSVRLLEAVSLNDNSTENSSVTIVRHFDRLFVTCTVFYNEIDAQSGVRFGILPEGFGYGLSSDELAQNLGR